MMKRIFSFLLVLALVFSIAPPVAQAAEEKSAMVSSQELVDKMKAREGFESKPYWDYGHWTIGYGTTCPDDKVDYYNENPMSKAEAEEEFKKHLGSFEKSVNNFADKYDLDLEQHQFDALVAFSYNCGAGWMSSTDGYFNTAVREGDMGAALLYGMALYSTAGGEYILIGRRLWEANMYLNGDYGEGEKGNYPESYRWVFLDGNGGKVRYKICAFDTKYKASLPEAFADIPIGTDKEGNTFVYEFAGWYTAAGKKVTQLDDKLSKGQYLYARWTDPEGNFRPDETMPKFPQKAVANAGCNIRKGAGTNYDKNGKLTEGQKVTVTEEKIISSNVNGETIWCKIGDNKWVTKAYLDYQFDTPKKNPADDGGTKISSLELVKKPTVIKYVQPIKEPDWEGSVLLATYKNGFQKAFTATRAMVSGFDGSDTGEQTVTAKYDGKTVKFTVELVGMKAPTELKSELLPDNTVRLSWSKGKGATEYAVYSRKAETAAFQKVGTTKELSFDVSDLERNGEYEFRVYSVYNDDGIYKQGLGTKAITVFVNEKMTAPTALEIERAGETAVNLSWKAAKGATHYQVLYKAEGAKSFTKLDLTKALKQKITGLKTEVRYEYRVVSYLVEDDDKQEGPRSRPLTEYLNPTLGKVSDLSVKQQDFDSAKLTWKAGKNATHYEVQYKLSTEKTYKKLGTTTKLTYTAKGLKPHDEYDFRVVSYLKDDTGSYAGPKASITLQMQVKLAAVTELKATLADHDDVKLTWKAAKGATHYAVQYRKKGASSYKTSKTVTKLNHTITDLTDNAQYEFRVVSYYKDKTGSYKGSATAALKFNTTHELSATKKVTLKLYGYDDVQISWSKVQNADAYNVYFKATGDSGYKFFGRFTGTSAKRPNNADGKKYTFKVVPCTKVNGVWYEDDSAKTASITMLKTVSKPKVTKYNSSKVKVSWTDISGESGYQVGVYSDKACKKAVTTTTTTGKYKTISVKKGVTYYYKVRAYKTVDGKKIYAPWSGIVSFKLK